METKEDIVFGLRMANGFDIIATGTGKVGLHSHYVLKKAIAVVAQHSNGGMSVSVAPLSPLMNFRPSDESTLMQDVEIHERHILFTYEPNPEIVMRYRTMKSGLALVSATSLNQKGHKQ